MVAAHDCNLMCPWKKRTCFELTDTVILATFGIGVQRQYEKLLSRIDQIRKDILILKDDSVRRANSSSQA